MCTHFTKIFGEAIGYCAWDVLTAAYIVDTAPVVKTVEDMRILVHDKSGSSTEGRTEEMKTTTKMKKATKNTKTKKKNDDDGAVSGLCRVLTEVDAEAINALILSAFRAI